MKKAIWILICVCLLVGGIYWYSRHVDTQPTAQTPKVPSYKNSTYLIHGQSVALIDGRAEIAETPSSSVTTLTQYFGNEATGDLDGNGEADTAFILTQSTGGSGTFYYVVVALKGVGGYVGTNAILLGDRIAPQSTEIKDGQLIVNYAERKVGDPMTTPPSVGVSKYLKVEGNTLLEVVRTAKIGEHCGGNMTTVLSCSAGAHCAPVPGSHLPFGDVGGVCVAD